MNKNTRQIAIPFISVILGIILGAIIMWIFGYDALWGYEELFLSLKHISETKIRNFKSRIHSYA